MLALGVVLAAVSTAPPASAFFCFSFSFGGGPRQSWGPPGLGHPSMGPAGSRYGYPQAFGHSQAFGQEPPYTGQAFYGPAHPAGLNPAGYPMSPAWRGSGIPGWGGPGWGQTPSAWQPVAQPFPSQQQWGPPRW